MSTFLTTSKMTPALAARIEASVTGKASADPGMRSRRLRRYTAIARVVIVVTLTWGLWSGFGAWRQSKVELSRARTTLLEKARTESAALTQEAKDTPRHIETWLTRLAGPWDDDFVDDAVRTIGLARLLESQGTVYLRAPMETLAKPSAIPGAAASSVKDSLLFCLADPPSARTEAALLDKVRVSYGGGGIVEATTAHTRRLHELLVGMPFLMPAFSDSVRAASDREAIARMQKDFDRAPIAQAKQAARAPLLLVAVDEPGSGGGPTELDGERPHVIRLYLVDLLVDRVLLRSRKVVDPSWISVAKRPHYARGIDSCAFAFDVHEDVKKSK